MFIKLQEKPRYALTIASSGRVISSTYDPTKAVDFKDSVLNQVCSYYYKSERKDEGKVIVQGLSSMEI